MAVETYTRAELRDQVLDYLRTHLSGVNVASRSYHWFLAAAIGAVLRNAQAGSVYTSRQILPLTADEEFLIQHGEGRKRPKLAATSATGKILFTVTSVGPHSITAGTSATHASGSAYATASTVATATAGWSGKTVAPGSDTTRVLVAPDAGSMAIDDVLKVTIASVDYVRAIKAILPDTGSPVAIEFYRPLPVTPAIGNPIAAVEGVVATATATTTGAATTLDPDEDLSVSSPPAGVDGTAKVLVMDGGADLETAEEHRQRLLAFDRERPGAGNRSDIRDWARDSDLTGVRIADAFVYSGARGLGTVDVVPFGLPGKRQTGTAVNDAIQAALDAQLHYWADIDVVQLQDQAPTDLTLSIKGLPGYEPDFTGTVTTAAGSTTSTINTATDPRLVMEVGDRILVPVSLGVDGDVEQVVVASMTASTIVPETTLSTAPGTGVVIRSGGALAQPVIDAVLELFDNVGPGDSEDVGFQRWPYADEYRTVVSFVDIACAAEAIVGVDTTGVTITISITVPGPYERMTLGALTLVYT